MAVGVHAADASKPHSHKGVLKPYPRPPAALTLSEDDKSKLAAGKAVMRQTEGEAGGRGLAVFRVHAPPEVTWATINDFKNYPKYISEVKDIEVYKKDGGNIDVRFAISSWGVSIEYFIHHDYDMANRWGTWTLDYTRESDLDDSVGFWRVTPVDGQPEQSTVEYSVDIAIKGWVPGFVRGLLVDNGLKAATTWVKVQSEKRYKKDLEKRSREAPPTEMRAPITDAKPAPQPAPAVSP
jgi:ribosome-associated toxin RatA of RatAB toxin-antitoxin module